MTGRRVLVTGAGGLIGRAIVARLAARGDSVVAIIRPDGARAFADQVQIATIDLAERPGAALSALGSLDAALHLAQAPGWHDFPRNAGHVAALSVAASAYVAEAAVAGGAKVFVLASSGGIYGPSPTPIVETDPIKPAEELGFYLAAKAAAEQLMHYFSRNLTVHILRPFFVYGPGQGQSFLLPRLIQSVRSGTPIRLDGGRGPRLNPLHVSDAAAAFIAALDEHDPLVANIAGPDIVSVRDIAELAAAQLGVPAQFDAVEAVPNDFVADTTVMSRHLGAPMVDLKAGLIEMIEV